MHANEQKAYLQLASFYWLAYYHWTESAYARLDVVHIVACIISGAQYGCDYLLIGCLRGDDRYASIYYCAQNVIRWLL